MELHYSISSVLDVSLLISCGAIIKGGVKTQSDAMRVCSMKYMQRDRQTENHLIRESMRCACRG
jgi:hypothetical protein